uniref:Uncharacterized protein n=1 Tax=Hyaloperonospora arabidopsidis (strain Emoy2) TaxID=559515 RepID=M4C2V9_HYAAE
MTLTISIEERKALAEARGRVANLRAMFNKGSVQNAEPPAWKRRVAPPPPVKLPTATDKSVDETTNGQPEDRKIKPSYSRVKSSESLVDAAVQERKVRDDQERLTAQEVKDAMAKQSSYHLESDRAYNFSLRQQRSVRMAERMAKKSLAQFSSNGPTFEDEKREEKRRREEAERKKEQEAQNALRNFAGGKTFFEEQLDEKKRVQELERQQEQCAKEAKSNFSSPNFDHAYTRAKEVAQVEKEAEGKAKAALLKYDQRVVAHEYGMKNGMMVHKQSGTGDTPKDPAARIKKPSPQSVKALARFQAQLAENRAREEQKASEEVLRKASWESMRKMSMESIESVESVSKQSVSEIDVEQLRASVDEGKLDVRSAAQKFAEMDRRAAEQAKQSKRPTTFNGVSYGRACPKEDEQQKVKDRNEGAKRIQSRVRGMIAREAFSKKVTASNRIAISIQTEFRRRRARKQFENLLQQQGREHSCAIAIQKVVRGRLRRNRYRIEATVYKAAIVLLQSHVRSWQAQTAYTKRIKAACQIQAFMARTLSGWHARNEVAGLRKQRAAATTIQVMLRMRAEALQTRSRRAATIQLQCAWRQTIARRTFDRLKRKATKRKAAQLDLENVTATKIQSLWRGTAARSEVSMLRAEAAAAEAAASEAARQEEVARQEEDARRKEAARQEEVARELEVKSSMATKIQSHWRGMAARSEVSTLRAEAAAAEAAASEAARQEEVARQEEDARRKEAARQEEVARELEVKSSMATKIQSHWRGTAARSEVSTLRAEAAAAETAASEAARQEEVARQEEDARRKEAARQEEVARELEVKSSMATKIQSHWRGMAARGCRLGSCSSGGGGPSRRGCPSEGGCSSGGGCP